MKTVNSNVDEIKIPKWLAAKDAKQRDQANEVRYTEAQKQLGDELYNIVATVYSSRVFKNYRARFIAVKVETPRISDYQTLVRLEKFCDDNNIERVRTNTAVLYRIK